MPNFEVFKGRGSSVVTEPYVTFQKGGSIALSKPAYELLGSPGDIELLFDPAARIVGFRGTKAAARHAYPVRHTVNNPGQFLVSGTAFTKYYRLDFPASRKYIGYLEGDVFCIDLNSEGIDIVGNRTKGSGSNGTSAAEAAGLRISNR